ncbi:hypothetical protein F8M41_026349 [Gigaspora margarita]|uniref:Uncharacterized protein n=1 Tax=Gigaspora margarita TaxID=4874 RepID=A0A8H4AZR3_GIGMA|nr:hypothetical protein F8M41_026349 [Gigaspora margarita]
MNSKLQLQITTLFFLGTIYIFEQTNQLEVANLLDKIILQLNKSQQTTLYKINQSSETSTGQSNLLEITNLPRNFKSINLPYRQIKFGRLLSQIDYKEILALIDIFNNLDLPLLFSPYQPQINILSREIHLIYHSIKTPYYQNQLIQTYNNILNLNTIHLNFFTDASIKNLQSSNIKSGIGWICENDPSIYFNAAINPSPDSSRSELMATIPLLLAIPNNCHYNIY